MEKISDEFAGLDKLIREGFFIGLDKLIRVRFFLQEKPASCEEEENLRLLAKTDLGEDLTDNWLKDAIENISNWRAPIYPSEVVLAPSSFKALQDSIDTRIHTGHVTTRKVK